MTESIENSLSRQYTFKVLRTDECKKMAHNHTRQRVIYHVVVCRLVCPQPQRYNLNFKNPNEKRNFSKDTGSGI
jgi:hypothetical protein